MPARAALDLHDNRRSSCLSCRSASRRSACSTASSATRRSPAAGGGCRFRCTSEPGPRRSAATALVVVIITMLTIIFGELVPKRSARCTGNGGALVAAADGWMSWIARPLVKLLSWAPTAIAEAAGPAPGPPRSVTEEEIAASLEEGVDAGVIEAQEHQMVRNVFRLDDRPGRLDDDPAHPGDRLARRRRAARTGGARDRRTATLRYPGAAAGLTTCWASSARRRPADADRRRGEPCRWRTRCSRRCSCPRRCRAWNCSSSSAPAMPQMVFVVDEYGEVQA